MPSSPHNPLLVSSNPHCLHKSLFLPKFLILSHNSMFSLPFFHVRPFSILFPSYLFSSNSSFFLTIPNSHKSLFFSTVPYSSFSLHSLPRFHILSIILYPKSLRVLLGFSHFPTQFSIFLSHNSVSSSYSPFTLTLLFLCVGSPFSFKILFSPSALTIFHSFPQFLITPTIPCFLPQLFIIQLDTEFGNCVLNCVFLLPMSFLKSENIFH